MKDTRSLDLYRTAQQYLVGGVCSSTRVNRAIERPFFAARGEGAWVYDADGNRFLDLCTSHGAGLLGHNHPAVREAIMQALEMGMLCAFETEYHAQLGQALTEIVPCADLVRFTGSGTEATMHALRACRAYTGKSKVLRFEGHFHGYHDYTYIGGHPPIEYFQTGSGKPYIECDGIPEAMTEFVISIPFNDPDAFVEAIRRHEDETCCVILEPVNYNCACILPEEGYLELLREETEKRGVLLFFDEVQSAFKKVPGGAQEYFGVTPDIAAIGKSLGGGMPLSAFAGKREVMECVRPVGSAEHSGTFNAPLTSILASLAFVGELRKPDFYPHLEELENAFYPALQQIFDDTGLTARIQYFGARFNIVFGVREEIVDYQQALDHDKDMMLTFIREAMERGVYFHDYGGSPCHHGFSIAHTVEDMAFALERLEDACRAIARRSGNSH